MNRIFPILLFGLFILTNCNQNNESVVIETVETYDPNAYGLEDIPNSSFKKAIRKDSIGSVLEEGFLEGSTRQGTWTTYHPGTNLPATLTSFVNGYYNGKYLEFNNRGQLTLLATYKNNLLDGPWEKYNFGRVVNSASYKDGKLEGIYREYHPTKINVLQKEIEYKNGVQDGIYRFFNEEGQLTVEYKYKNGKKVSGGIIEK